MIVVAAILSGIGLYFSTGLGEQWALGWVAAVPVLWLAFGETSAWRALAAAFAAYALAGANYLVAYWGIMPPAVLALAVVAPALLFTLAAGGARFAYRRISPVAGVLAFALLWAGLDFLSSLSRHGGAVMTVSAPQIDAPMVVQAASLVGFYGVTFLLGAVNGALAAALRERSAAFALGAVALFAANAAFGLWRMSEPPSGALRVALIASNDVTGPAKHEPEDEAKTLQAIAAYAAQIDQLARSQPDLIVMPENISRLGSSWREKAEAQLAEISRKANATLVAGFNVSIDGAQRNVSMAFARGAAPVVYEKRHLVPEVETAFYTPGNASKVLANGIGLEVCKDMDHHKMIRDDIASGRPIVLAVPAWDFGHDGWAHARIALMRSVENGVPIARSAREGWLTLNDRYGRVLGRAEVGTGFTTLVGTLSLAGRGGDTLYSRIGDVFGWASAALGACLVLLAQAKRRDH